MTERSPGGVGEDERQRAVDVLCEAFAEDRVSVEEFERRVEVAHAATSREELQALLADLVRARPPAVREGGRTEPEAGADPASTGMALDRGWSLPPMARPDEVGERALIFGILGGGGRSGPWVPARTTLALGLMGGVEIDLREAIFPPGVTEIRALAFWGGVEIIAPPGVRVEASGIGLLGGFEHHSTVAPTDNPDAPVLRVTGLACMGGVEVTVRYPGESGRDARRRVRARRKERKRLARKAGKGGEG
ncbi:MAG: DUF1707 domain-containing protein [Gemmatimonadota bacterium]